MRARHTMLEGRGKAVPNFAFLLTAAAVLLMSLAACETDEWVVDVPDTPKPTTASEEAPAETTTVRITLATTDLGVGLNRLAFGLVDAQSGPIREADR